MDRILITDDEKSIRFVLGELLRKRGFATVEAASGPEAIEVLRKERPDAVLLDHKMPGMDGFATMLELKKIDPMVPIIFVTAKGDVSIAVEAIKSGAYDFITKPPDIDGLALTIKRAIEKLGLERELNRLNTAVGASMECLLGKSEPMKKVIAQISQVASSDFSIIIQGETGSGKTTAAELIHNMSKRRDKPFLRVDIGALPDTLVESELFGYEKGAFTGADKNKRGYFELANGGTLFIDELQNMSLSVQSKLLGAVEQKKIFPVGGTKPVSADVRIISATNNDILQLVKEKKFREDLFFRLSEFMITIPPLRERVDDMHTLALRFCRDACAELNKPMVEISESALNILNGYSWPGNVRELKNVMRRAVLLSSEPVINPEHLDFLIKNEFEKINMPILPLKEICANVVRDAEKAAIKQVLAFSNGNKSKAASILQIDYKTLLTKVKLYDI